jgi:hypothetical protein
MRAEPCADPVARVDQRKAEVMELADVIGCFHHALRRQGLAVATADRFCAVWLSAELSVVDGWLPIDEDWPESDPDAEDGER